MKLGNFLFEQPYLDEFDVESAHASAFSILKSFKNNTSSTEWLGPGLLCASGATLVCLLLDGPQGTMATTEDEPTFSDAAVERVSTSLPSIYPGQ
jgi:hypothetical protein